tara:strand:+ start:137 stop:622 length:486 start_codon:yes stop_codon:yes gene_type:complete
MKNSYLTNYIFLFIILIILFIILKKKVEVENFLPGVFGFAPRIPGCTPENDCYPGSYAATQKYHNMCQPSFGLNRQKIGLQDHCTHDLGKMSGELYLTQNNLIPKIPSRPPPRSMIPFRASPDQNTLVCTVDEHLQRRCKWVKPNKSGCSKPGIQSVHPPA